MNRTITREQKMLAAAGANVLFIISLFFPWFGSGDFSISGDDVVPSWWVLLVFAAVAAIVLAADALNFELPVQISPTSWGAYLSSVPFIFTAMLLFEGDGRRFGLFLALVFSLVATVLAVAVWREDR